MSKEDENAVSEQGDDECDPLEREIAREVEEAFATIPYPGDERLLANPDYYDRDEVIETFQGKHWRELSRNLPPERDLTLAAFTPEAFRFYLPAYLVMSLLRVTEVGLFWESTFMDLTPPASSAPRRKWFLEYISPLDARQKAALRRFVELAIPGAARYPQPRKDRAIYFWQRIADLDRTAEPDEREQDSALWKLRKAMLGESALSEQEAREVKALEQEIAREVEEAFAAVPPPAADSAAQWEDVPKEFRGKHWRDLSLKLLSKHPRSPGLFSPEAFHFFLPAYLIAALLHAEETDEMRDEVFYDLMFPPDEFFSIPLFLARIKPLDARQKAVVRRFVELWARTATLYPEAIKERGLSFWRRATETERAEGR